MAEMIDCEHGDYCDDAARRDMENLRAIQSVLLEACRNARDRARSRLPCDALGLAGEAFLNFKLDEIAHDLDVAISRAEPH